MKIQKIISLYLVGLKAFVNSAYKINVLTYMYSLVPYPFSLAVKLLFYCFLYSGDICRKALCEIQCCLYLCQSEKQLGKHSFFFSLAEVKSKLQNWKYIV